MLEVANWKYSDLENWLKNPSTQESWDYEFNSQIPDSRDDKGKDRLRHEFYSFANSRREVRNPSEQLVLSATFNFFQRKTEKLYR